MKIIRAKDYYDMSRKAANIISAQVIMKPNCVLGLATGGTPVGTYKHDRQSGRVPRPAEGTPRELLELYAPQPVRPCQCPPRGHQPA